MPRMPRILVLHAAALVMLAACGPESPPAPSAPVALSELGGCTDYPWGESHPSDSEEELFGELEGFAGATTATLTTIRSGAQSTVWVNRLPACRKSTGGNQGGHANNDADYGWYSPNDANNHCGHVEHHRPEEEVFDGEEQHCASPGRYSLVLDGAPLTARELDFVTYQGAFAVATDPEPGVHEVFHVDIPQVGVAPYHRDLLVDYRSTPGPTVSPVIEISPKPAALIHSDRWNPIVPSAGAYHIPLNFHLRVGAWKSTGAPPEGLVRYFWNYPSSPGDRTGFANLSISTDANGVLLASGAHVRTHQYPTTGTFTLVAHLIQPWDYPTGTYDPADVSYGTVVTKTIQVHPALEVTLGAQPSSPAAGQSVTFTAAGGNGGGGNSLSWDFGDSNTTVTPSGTVTHTYAVADTYPVTVTKSDQYGYMVRTSLSVVVTAPVSGPAGPPTNLGATGVTSTTATINWVNGDATTGTTTFLEYRPGAGAWIPATGSNGLGNGVASLGLSGLAPATSYSVRMWHVKNGIASDIVEAPALFLTNVSAGLPAVESFRVTSCRRVYESSKWRLYWTMSWTPTTAPAGTSFEIGQASTNSPGSANIIASGLASKGFKEVGPYLDVSYPTLRYFWVRFTDGVTATAWFPLSENPLDVGGECAL